MPCGRYSWRKLDIRQLSNKRERQVKRMKGEGFIRTHNINKTENRETISVEGVVRKDSNDRHNLLNTIETFWVEGLTLTQ